MDAHESFAAGWAFGATWGRVPTAREIARRFPAAQVDSFAEGATDGVEGDRFRLDWFAAEAARAKSIAEGNAAGLLGGEG